MKLREKEVPEGLLTNEQRQEHEIARFKNALRLFCAAAAGF